MHFLALLCLHDLHLCYSLLTDERDDVFVFEEHYRDRNGPFPHLLPQLVRGHEDQDKAGREDVRQLDRLLLPLQLGGHLPGDSHHSEDQADSD